MINLHPPATAFPFAFGVLLVGAEIFFFFRPAAQGRFLREVLLGAYGVGVLLAFFSGYHGSEFAALDKNVIADAVSVHHTVGKVLLFLMLPTVCFGFLYSRASRGRKALALGYALLLFLSFALTVYTGYLGGELVFTHGAGVQIES